MGIFDSFNNAPGGMPNQNAPKPKKEKKVIDIKPQGRGKKFLINILVTFVVGFVYFYIKLPALNFQAEEFYFFFFIMAAVYVGISIITSGIWRLRGQDEFLPSVKKSCRIPLAVCAVFLVVILVGTFLSGVVIRARSYRDLLEVNTGNFQQDVAEVSFDQIPRVDRDSAARLGNRKLGELSDMVSQFEVADDYTQINYKERPVRVTPLEYGDLIKWLTNRSKGLPGYVMVDMVTQNAEVVRLKEGMKYTTTEHFSRNLMRHLRFNYPMFMFDVPTFEIDDNGDPYWICPRLVKRIGLFGGRDIEGAVIVNAVTGESQYYETVPQWVDRVYSAELIIEQYDYYGMYQNGFLNSIFGQRGVTITTKGYNYIAMNDDVYVYTGVTSAGTDQSNVGFLLSNQRTKETTFFSIAGAEEYSAMSSAEGVVQHLNYVSTFPLLLNIKGQPTYFMALKDNAGLVKQYAMVNVRQYQLVATGATVSECEETYLKLLKQSNIADDGSTNESVKTDITGVVTEIRDAVIEGNTFYYLKLEGSDSFYAVSAYDSEIAVIVSVGDTVRIDFAGDDGSAILAAKSLEIISQNAAAPTPLPAPEPEKLPAAPETEVTENTQTENPSDVQAA
ncbi:MAG: CvpA family protein [Oscillospiraceae bacterium]